MNTFGNHFRLTTFGESHGPAIGGIIDGVPSGLSIDLQRLQEAVDRRTPQKVAGATGRREPDQIEILSGIYGGVTLGTPVGFIIRNLDARPQDYTTMGTALRPNHADYTYMIRYGLRDPRGGGRASARETACRVVAGAIASQILELHNIDVRAWTEHIGGIHADTPENFLPTEESIYSSPVRCPYPEHAAEMETEIGRAAASHDTLGGIVRCIVTGIKAGIGNPVADKLQALLAAAMMSIPAAKGFDYGDGFAAAADRGSRQCDIFAPDSNGGVRIMSNHSGGIQGGITNGQPIVMRVAFKPVATMPGREISTVDNNGNPCTLRFSGRHDVCAVPRAVSVVQAMASITVLDAIMASVTPDLRR